MIKDVDKYFIEEDNCYKCKWPLTIVRIKKSFIEKGLTEEILKDVHSIGVFYIYFYDKIDTDSKPKKTLLLHLPMTFILCPKEKSDSTEEGEPAIELRFYENDIFMKARNLVQGVVNVEKGFDLLYNNFMPAYISYSNEFILLKDCKNINKIGLKMSDQMLALIVAEANRDPNNVNRAFRFALKDNPDMSEYNRKLVRLVDLARLNSIFIGLASAHASRSLTVGITKHRMGEDEQTGTVVDLIK